jgi:two-component system sensor histidine kinase/response regulator
VTATHDDAHPGSLLVVEDSPSDFAVLKAHLRDGPFADSRIDHSATLAGALDRLRDTSYSAVLVDLGLPDSEGLETFDRVASSAGRAAVLVLTGLADERLAEEAVHRGAQDYPVKGTRGPGEIARAVDYAIRRQSLLAELRDARDEQLAAKDRFLSHVSHELRSPLAVVHQFSSLLLDGIGGPLSADQQEFLAVVMRNVGQLRLMIDDLLTVSHAHRTTCPSSARCSRSPDCWTKRSARSGPLPNARTSPWTWSPGHRFRMCSQIRDGFAKYSAICWTTR